MGEKWCTSCKVLHARSAFGKDSWRKDGLAASCTSSRRAAARLKYVPRPRVSKLGAHFVPTRHGDAEQARARVNHQVSRGQRPRPNSLPCVDCGHVWEPGQRRHEYDHHRGYEPEFHLDVVPVCTICHARRTNATARCRSGKHERTAENTGKNDRGYRLCLDCRRERDSRRRVRRKGEKFPEVRP